MNKWLFRFGNLIHNLKVNLTQPKLKPGDVVTINGLFSPEYLVLETDYHYTKESQVLVYSFTKKTKVWYMVSWFIIVESAQLSRLEAIIYNTDDLTPK